MRKVIFSNGWVLKSETPERMSEYAVEVCNFDEEDSMNAGYVCSSFTVYNKSKEMNFETLCDLVDKFVEGDHDFLALRLRLDYGFRNACEAIART